jgi:hypothetical protein
VLAASVPATGTTSRVKTTRRAGARRMGRTP